MFYIWMSIVYYLKTEISESKLDSPILNSEQDIEIYNFIQMDHSRGESEVTCIRKSVSYSHYPNFCLNQRQFW